MTIILPGAMFAAGISLYYFYEFNRAKEAKLDERRESLNDRRQEFLQQTIEAKRKKDAKNEHPSTAGSDEHPSTPGSNEPANGE